MKRSFTFFFGLKGKILLLALISGLGGFSQVPEWMYYKFDATGNQVNSASAPVGTNPATLDGLTTGSTGQFGTALIGNGLTSTSNRLNTGWATNLPSTGWTISFWLNNFPASAATTYYYFGDASAGSFRCFTGGVAGNGNLWLRGTGFTDVPINAIPSTPTVIHLVYTGTAVRVYFNGVFNSSVAQAAVAITGTGPFLVGGYSSSNSINAGTLMDEFRLYNRALTDAEVASTWNTELFNGPVAVTAAATAITGSTATLNGTVNANGASTTVTFEYGLTVAYGTTVNGVPATVTGTSATPVSAAISGLTPNTLYHYRVKGVNGSGTSNGLDMTFTTGAPPPTVVTTAATGIGLNTATLNGTVNANNASTAVTFNYGLTVAYGSMVAGVPSPVTGTTVTAVTAAIAGLTPNTLYHYRVAGTSTGGSSNGLDMTFTTSGPPVVVTNLPTNVTGTSATLNGTVTASGASTTVSFDWGLTIAYGTNVAGTPSPVTGNTPTAVSANISGLTSGATYHYRCVGVNGAGTTNGLDQVFTAGCQPPVAPGTITGSAAVCAGSAGNIYSILPVPSATSYNWTVPAGATVTAGQGTLSATISFGTTSGNVSVQGVGACGGGPFTNLAITVNSLPSPTVSGPATACQGSSTNVYTTQTGMSGYTWTVSAGGTLLSGAGTSSVTVRWNNTGAQAVNVNYANASGCQAASPVAYNVTVNAAPLPTITGVNSLCATSGYYDYTTQSGNTGYTWTVSSGGTIISGQGNSVLTVYWSTGGAQFVSVNYANASGCYASSPAQYAVTVNSVPGPAGAVSGPASVCANATGVNYSCAPVAGATAYAWTLPSGFNVVGGANTNSIMVDVSSSAVSGSILVSGNTICGNGVASPPYTVTVNALPAAAGAVSGPASVCAGSTGNVYTVPSIANATGYTWTIPTGASVTSGVNTNSITVSFANTPGAGSFSVFGTNSCGNGGVSPLLAVTIHAVPPIPTVSASGYLLTSSASSGNQWYLDGNAISGATSQTYTVPASEPGWYWTVVTVNTCSSDSSNNVYIAGVGVGELNGAAINVYPVPNDGHFRISFANRSETSYDIRVCNELGVPVFILDHFNVAGTLEKQIDISPAPAGVYTVVVTNNGNRFVRKIIITN